MIRVVGLNPVIDRMYYIDRFQENTKFYEISPEVYVGGKGINVARVLSQMGECCVLYTFLGGIGGSLIEKEMRAYQVDIRPFYTEGETRTTINIIDKKRGRETEITEPGVTVGKERQEEFLEMLKKDMQPGDMVICTGIPMKGMDEGIYLQISRMCQERGCLCILDATGPYLKKSLPGSYYFFKPNFYELAELFGISQEDNLESILKAGYETRKLGVENLLISMGERGGIFFGKKEILQAKIPRAKTISTIGSGDATVTGFCLGINRHMSKPDCIRLAMACGISNACHREVGYVSPEDVRALFQQITISRYM